MYDIIIVKVSTIHWENIIKIRINTGDICKNLKKNENIPSRFHHDFML